jgi:putative hydrolase of the HAD superfamily
MRYDALVFDLFGTLVDNLPRTEFERTLAGMSDAVTVPREDFAKVWVEKMNDRMIGKFGGTEGNIACVCEALGFRPSADRMAEAAEIRLAFTRRALEPRQNALETLRGLRSLGLKVGLVSDCTAEVPLLWADTTFVHLIQAPVFSCSVGTKKPDPRMYNLACRGLGVAPENCLYIGDGASDELTGATKIGMDAALILPHEPDGYDHLRGDAQRWTGPVISDLSEIVGLLRGN